MKRHHILRQIITIVCIVWAWSYSFWQSDIYIEQIQLNNTYTLNNQVGIIQNTTPRISIIIGNNGPDDVETSDVLQGFLVCVNNATSQQVFNSSSITNMYIPVWWFWQRSNLQLNPNLTQTIGTKNITCTINPWQAGIIDTDTQNNQSSITFGVFTPPTNRFDLTLGRAIESIEQNLDPAEAVLGTAWVVNFIRKNVINIIIPIFIVIGVIVAMIWFYKMMFRDGEEALKEGANYILRGVIGIVIMISAWYLTSTVLFDNIFIWWDIQTINGIQVAQVLYEQAIFPFIKIAMYIAIGILFIVLAIRVLQYLTNPSEDVKKQAATLITWSIIGILVILGSKQIVELVFWSQESVMDESIQDIGEIGTWIFSGNFPILYTIINRIMGLAAFIILIIIILQTYQLLTNPTNEENMTKIKRSFLYITIGILVIGAGYVITNFLIIN